jgi:uncharacterized protein
MADVPPRAAVLAAVAAHVDAFNRRDLVGVVAGFDEGAVFASADALVVGRRGLTAMFSEAFAGDLQATLELRQAVVDGETAACELTERVVVEGMVHELSLAAFFTVRGGVLARVKVYREGAAG